MSNLMKKTGRVLATMLAALQITALGVAEAGAQMQTNIRLKILAINDFHGQIGTGMFASGRALGSAPVLAGYLKRAQAGMEDGTIIVSAGDLVGASPADSGLLQDEPSVMFLNALATNCLPDKMSQNCNMVATVGNHEFDEGVVELLRMMNGGIYPGNPPGTNAGPFLENPYTGAHFPYVAANITYTDSVTHQTKTLLPPYFIKTVQNVPIAFIGAILKDMPNSVVQGAVAGLTFLDEADAINSYVPELQAKGVHAIVVIIHQGGSQTGAVVSGNIVPIVNRLDGDVDVVISGHTHTMINGLLKNKANNDVLVTQAYSEGVAYADISLEIDPLSGDIVKKSATIPITWVKNTNGSPAVTPDPVVADIVARADQLVSPRVNQIIGYVTASITSKQNDAGESALGNLIADAERAYTRTDFAFTNMGGIRNDITYNSATGGAVTWGDLFSVQPLANQMVTMTLTGQQIYDLLAQQWRGTYANMLQISGLSYSWTLDPVLKKGSIIEVRRGGIPIDKSATYSVTANNFIAGGSSGFTVFLSGLNPLAGATDIDVLVAYIKGLPQPFSAAIDGRIQLMATPDRTKVNLMLTAGGSAGAATPGTASSLQTGYAVTAVTSGNAPYGTAVFGVSQYGFVVSEAAVPTSPPTTAARIFVDYGTRVPSGPAHLGAGPVDIFTGIAVVNPGSRTSNITYTLRDMQGRSLAAGRGTLAPGAHRARFLQQLQELAPDLVLPADFATATRFGSLEIAGDQPLSITALRMTVNQRGNSIFTTIPVADLAQNPSLSPVFFPHVADGDGYLSTIILLNTTHNPQSGVLRLFGDAGSPLTVRQSGGAEDSSFRYTIPSDGTCLFQTDGSHAVVQVGSLQLIPDPGSTSPAGAGIFNRTSNGILVTESGIPAAIPTTHARIYVDMADKHDSGLAIAGTTAANLPITLKAYQIDGSTPAGSPTNTLSIPGNGHTAAFVRQWVSGLPSNFKGVLDIFAPVPFAALTLRALTNARQDFLITTFPIADLTRPAPAPLVFPQIADGGGYRTEFILLSSRDSAAATVSFFGDDGTPLALGSVAAIDNLWQPVVRQNLDRSPFVEGSWLRDADLFLPCTARTCSGASLLIGALGQRLPAAFPEGVNNVMRGRSRDR